jgi:hypothetical protein
MKPRTFDDMLAEMRALLSSSAHTPEDLEAFADEAGRWERDLRRNAELWRKVGTERFKGPDWTPPAIPGRLRTS